MVPDADAAGRAVDEDHDHLVDAAAWAGEIGRFAARLGVPLTTRAIELMIEHWRLVEVAGTRTNLTTIGQDDALYKHICDSLTAAVAYDGSGTAADVGSGAGYPGVVLACAFPNAPWTLIEAAGKKARFLEGAVAALGLSAVRVDGRRVEDVVEEGRRFDWVTARAVGPLPVALEWCVPLLARGGRAVAMRGPGGAVEAREAAPAVTALGGVLEQVVPLTLPAGAGQRVLVVVRKVADTPGKYPRRGGALGRFRQDPSGALKK